MPVVRQNWISVFGRNSFPGLPCPYCAPGKMKLVPGSLSVVEPTMSVKYRDNQSWEPDNVVQRWSARLECDEASCGEIVHMIGDTDLVETFVEEVDTWGLEDVLRVRAIFPAPPLFRVPISVPNKVRNELELAFQLFWSDLSASLGRLRTAVEKMLDDQKIKREGIDKNGDVFEMKLNDRINAFSKLAHGADAKDMLHGLRNIGNMGAHGNEVTREDLFDAIDVLEDVLLGIYEKGSIKAKAQKLLDKKPEA
jgi:hypothetical protein